MTVDVKQSIAIIAVVALCTMITRAIPFLIFGRKRVPESVNYLGKVLPPTIIATLVIYCLKHIELQSLRSGSAEFISVGVVTALHLWKRNALLSIGIGTLCYMILIRMV